MTYEEAIKLLAFCIHCEQALEWEGTDNAQT